jgi:hypothetical protein
MALLAPFAVASAGQFTAYVVLTAAFAASLLYTLHEITPFDLPDAVANVLITPAGVWSIGLTLIAAGAAWAWLLLVRRPRLPAAGPDHEA